jgi:hypothetical protein
LALADPADVPEPLPPLVTAEMTVSTTSAATMPRTLFRRR